MAKRKDHNNKPDDFYIIKEELVAPGWTQCLYDDAILYGILGKIMSSNNKSEFKIPKPFRAWCHVCNKGFMTIGMLTSHNKFCSREYL